ncbi:DUF1178 family protein [Nitrospirillum pindoramense]|uniref:DUF1178 family protein n=1 Tax=Nitrospirillum amazonense TaxID=28077 RepID=A0A560H679_9PROT|nr:DUF1178 family protein [Nitrospirillum amazonense]TWB41803.1 hypothetical protein FBZ90_107177 [Nitrospirillum amazonense]
MILYEMKCGQGHTFDVWFRNADACDQQLAAGEVACAVCGDHQVGKAPMAPRIAKGRGGRAEEGNAPVPVPAPPQPAPEVSPAVMAEAAAQGPAAVLSLLREVRRQVEANATHVGDRFAEEARKIHYGETEAKPIYGQTTDEEAAELEDEGVTFARIPWVPKHDS